MKRFLFAAILSLCGMNALSWRNNITHWLFFLFSRDIMNCIKDSVA